MATSNFDPTKYGASLFDPTEQGATQADGELPGIGIIKGMAEAPSRYGKGIGTTISSTYDLSRKQKMADVDSEQMMKNSELAKELLKKGNKKGAQILLDANRKILERTPNMGMEAQNYQSDIERSKEDILKGGVGTAAFFIPGGMAGKGVLPAITRIGSSATMGGALGYGGSEKGNEVEATLGGAALGGALGAGIEAAKAAAPLVKKAVSKGGSIAGELGRDVVDVVKNPLKGGAGRKVGEEAAKGTAKGLEIAWDRGENNLTKQISDAVEKKFTMTTKMRKAVGELLADLTKTPETGTTTFGPSQALPEGATLPTIKAGAYSPTDLLRVRSQLTKTFPEKIFSALQGQGASSEYEKVASVARSVLSKNLHALVPETLSPDHALKIYHQLGIFGKFGLPGLVATGVLGSKLTGKLGNLLKIVNAVTGGVNVAGQ